MFARLVRNASAGRGPAPDVRVWVLLQQSLRLFSHSRRVLQVGSDVRVSVDCVRAVHVRGALTSRSRESPYSTFAAFKRARSLTDQQEGASGSREHFRIP